jgi:hypothetical protein
MSNEPKALNVNIADDSNVFISPYEADYGRYERLFKQNMQILESLGNMGVYDSIDILRAYLQVRRNLGCINKDFEAIANDLRRVMYRYAKSG